MSIDFSVGEEDFSIGSDDNATDNDKLLKLETAKTKTEAASDKTVLHLPPIIATLPTTPESVNPPDKTQVSPSISSLKAQERMAIAPPPDSVTLLHKPSKVIQLAQAAHSEPTVLGTPIGEAIPDLENPYILSGEIDRARLVAQTRLFKGYIEKNAKAFVGENIKSILDIGCGEGQLTLLFARLYPEARVVGIDRDEKAIDAARHASWGLPNVSFEVGDIQEALPKGPFDLIYESIVLFHVPRTQDVVKHIYEALAPGGYFWSKNMHPTIRTAINHPAYLRLFGWVDAAMTRIGAHVDIVEELPDILLETGFSNIRKEREIQAIGNVSMEGRLMMSVNLGALYNARKLASRVTQTPESELEKTYKELCDAMMAPDGPHGEYLYINTIAQRPPKVETLLDIENPYILSGVVDRARLVAQSRLFRGYIETHAKTFVGENIKSILDIGCGEGQLTQVFARLYPGARVVGIDLDEKAIDVARRSARGLPNVQFEAGNIMERLPEGPFDLVYGSLVLMHIQNTAKVLQLIYQVLNPGGYLWTKDLHPSIAQVIDHPAYERLSNWMNMAMERINSPWQIGGEMPAHLSAAGFNVLRTDREIYVMGNKNAEERITMSVNLGAIYNARSLMSKLLHVPESEIEKAYKEVLDAMMAPDGPRGEYIYVNTISQRSENANGTGGQSK